LPKGGILGREKRVIVENGWVSFDAYLPVLVRVLCVWKGVLVGNGGRRCKGSRWADRQEPNARPWTARRQDAAALNSFVSAFGQKLLVILGDWLPAFRVIVQRKCACLPKFYPLGIRLAGHFAAQAGTGFLVAFGLRK
jgi:hypothetical protein